MIFDTHAHYDDDAFDADREELLASLQVQGIGTVADIGASIASTKAALELAERYPFIYAVVGVHPNETAELNEDRMEWLEKAAAHPKAVAIGEIGLDYHWDDPERPIQKHWFIRQLELARKVSMPIVIHSRDAAQDTLDIIKGQKASDMGGIIHCFSYGAEMAREYLNMGFYLGVGGVLTYKNARKLKEVVEYMPMDRLVLETDSPYLTPAPHRGKRNCSLYLPYVVQAISEIRGISEEEVIEITERNARKVYRLD